MRPFVFALFLALASCTTPVNRAPSSLLKLTAPGECSARIRVFFAPKQVLVKDLDDFLRHTRLHVERTGLLASELLHKFPGHFDRVNDDLVQAFLKNHDQSKLNPELTQKGRRFIGERLYEFYGLPDSLLSEAEKEQRKKLIGELNTIDSVQITAFFKRNGLLTKNGEPNATARQLLDIEKIVDFVDRGKAPVSNEEFAKRMALGSDFIDEHLSEFAIYLEKNYQRIVAGSEYIPSP